MFSFSTEAKEKYYTRAEQYLVDNGIPCFLIDRERFGYLGREHVAKIYFVLFSSRMVKLLSLKALDRVTITNDRFSRHKQGESKALRENGYIKLEMDEEDW